MTEQELRDNEFRADMENALHQNRSLTMIAQTIWELAKAYADARESKEIAELKADNARWCKDFYKIKFELETATANRDKLEAEKRNAALVAALENMTDSGYLLNRCDESKEDDVAVVPLLSISAVQSMAKAALAANEKGGAND